jgi:hypothetical protein
MKIILETEAGLKGTMLKAFATTEAKCIVDVTPFVLEQNKNVYNNTLGKLIVPVERIYKPRIDSISKKISLDDNL